MSACILPAHGTISARWSDPRPLSNPGEHVHGALDISAPVGTPIVAPQAGTVYRFCLLRPPAGGSWEWMIRDGPMPRPPWKDYAYDVYGAATVLDGADGVHLLCHSYLRQLMDATRGIVWNYQEQPADARWPVMLLHTFAWPQRVQQGEVIAAVGNAGYSTGAHVHWEIHRGWTLTPYAERPDPETLL